MYFPPEEKATYISLATPFIALGMSCCMNPGRAFRTVHVSEVFAELAIFAVFAIFGLCCGIFGAVSFRSHGSYGIIVGCVIGMLLNGALLALVGLAVMGGMSRALGS